MIKWLSDRLVLVIDERAALSVWVWRFLFTLPKNGMGFSWLEMSLDLYPDYERPLREWIRRLITGTL